MCVWVCNGESIWVCKGEVCKGKRVEYIRVRKGEREKGSSVNEGSKEKGRGEGMKAAQQG